MNQIFSDIFENVHKLKRTAQTKDLVKKHCLSPLLLTLSTLGLALGFLAAGAPLVSSPSSTGLFLGGRPRPFPAAPFLAGA